MGVFTFLQSIRLALLNLQREGPVLKYCTLSAKETKQVNKRTRQSFASELGLKRNAICSAYSDYTSENRREERTIP